MSIKYALGFAAVTFAMTVVDVCYAKYTLEVAKHKALRAALWSMAIISAGSFVTISYVHDRSLIVAACIGAFLGTYLTIKWENKNGVGVKES